MNIKCPECGKAYRVDPRRIPAAGASVKCKQCAHVIKVSRETCASEPKRVIECPDCAKQYRIAESRIPATLQATQCKACGGTITLARDASSREAGEQPEASVSTPLETPDAPESGRKAGLFQQTWFLVTGIVVVVLLLSVVLWIVFSLPDDTGVSPAAPDPASALASQGQETSEPAEGTAPQTPAGSPLAEDALVRPVAVVTLRTPSLLQAVQGSTYLAELPPPAQMAMVTLATLSLGSIDLFVCLDDAGVLWPVLRVEKPMARYLAGQFGPDGALGDYFIERGEFTYQLNEPVIIGMLSQMISARAGEDIENLPSQDELSSVPLEQYAVVLEENHVWFTPDCVRSALGQSPDLFDQASWDRWMAPAGSDQDLLRVFALMPGDLQGQWTSWVLDHEIVQAHPEAGFDFMVAMAETPVNAMLKSVSRLEQAAVTLACPTPQQRRVTWVQQFKDPALAQAVHERLQVASVGAELGAHPLIPLVTRLLNCPGLQHTTELKARRLTVTFTWTEQDDPAILNWLGNGPQEEARNEIGASESLENDPAGPAEEQAAHAAELLQAVGLTRHLDEPTWRAQLSDRFVQALVPSSHRGFGGRDATFLEVEPWGDNVSLASVFYEVTQVMSPDGQVLTECAGIREPMTGRRIRVPRKEGTSAGEAVIRFEVSVPSELDTAVLNVGAGHEVIQPMVTGPVAMAKVADRTVRLVYEDGAMPLVYAFDPLGNRLRRERISRESDGVYLVFGGGVETCLIVGVQEEISHTFEARVNLDPGEATTLAYKPEVPRYTRFDQTPLVNHADVSSLDVNELAVHWRQEKKGSHFEQVLSVALPENVAVQPDWEVYAHHGRGKTRLNGTSVKDNWRAAYLCRSNGHREAQQVSGSLLLSVFGRIKRVTLQREDLEELCCVEMPGRTHLDLDLDKNRLSYMVLGGHVVQLAAYDAQGRRLKQDPAWQIQAGMKSVYFWGVPDRVILDVSTQTRVAKLDFEVTEPLTLPSQPLYTTSLKR